MQRTARQVSDAEMVDAMNAIIDIIIDCYNKPLDDIYETRSTRIGIRMVELVRKRRIMERYSDIGWRSQRHLLENQIIAPGGIKNEEE